MTWEVRTAEDAEKARLKAVVDLTLDRLLGGGGGDDVRYGDGE